MKIDLGIWTVHDSGIKGNQPQKTNGWIYREGIWSTTLVNNNKVWDIVIHIAHKTWATSKDINDLLKAMAIYRQLYPLEHQNNDECNNLDRMTYQNAGDIIKERNNSDLT